MSLALNLIISKCFGSCESQKGLNEIRVQQSHIIVHPFLLCFPCENIPGWPQINADNLPLQPAGGRSLRLTHAAVEDGGRYTCVVSNIAGEERKNFNLVILGRNNYFTATCVSRAWAVLQFNASNLVIQQFPRGLRRGEPLWTWKSKRNTTWLSPVRSQVIPVTSSYSERSPHSFLVCVKLKIPLVNLS